MYNFTMLPYLLSLITFLIAGCSNPFILTEAEKKEIAGLTQKAKNSKLIILDVYHNRCESCKEIEPVIEKLKSDYNQNNDIVFLKYDLSNPVTIFKSKQIARILDLESIYNLQKYSGIVLFIDLKEKHVVDTLIAEYSLNKYNEVIKERLKNLNAK